MKQDDTNIIINKTEKDKSDTENTKKNFQTNENDSCIKMFDYLSF